GHAARDQRIGALHVAPFQIGPAEVEVDRGADAGRHQRTAGGDRRAVAFEGGLGLVEADLAHQEEGGVDVRFLQCRAHFARAPAGEVRAALEESDIDTTLFLMRQIRFDEAQAALERNRATIAARGPLVPARVRAAIDFDLGRAYLEWGDVQRADPLISGSVP